MYRTTLRFWRKFVMKHSARIWICNDVVYRCVYQWFNAPSAVARKRKSFNWPIRRRLPIRFLHRSTRCTKCSQCEWPLSSSSHTLGSSKHNSISFKCNRPPRPWKHCTQRVSAIWKCKFRPLHRRWWRANWHRTRPIRAKCTRPMANRSSIQRCQCTGLHRTNQLEWKFHRQTMSMNISSIPITYVQVSITCDMHHLHWLCLGHVFVADTNDIQLWPFRMTHRTFQFSYSQNGRFLFLLINWCKHCIRYSTIDLIKFIFNHLMSDIWFSRARVFQWFLTELRTIDLSFI